jgi:hypothetical protein
MSHTPGPWNASGWEPGGERGPWAVFAPGAEPGRKQPAECYGPDREANARLIAAAPDLLNALIQCRSVLITALGDTPDDLDKPVREKVIRSKMELADAAIAKARGPA